MELTDRELALRWWSRRTIEEKRTLTDYDYSDEALSSLSDLIIEWFWRKQQS